MKHNDLFTLTGLFSSLLLLLVGHNLCAQTYAENGMVVSDQRLASEVGVEILRRGGNAVDAAVATAFALAVTHPEAGNIGGGGFMVMMDSSGSSTSIDFREKAPLKATETMFLDEEGRLNKAEDAKGKTTGVHHIGVRAVGVPGTVAGLYLAHRKYGKLAWRDLVQPAIDLAVDGISLTWDLYQNSLKFRESNQQFMRNFFLDANGDPLGFGETWRQPDLAETLIQIRDKGHKGFYRGAVAREIARYMKEQGGLITRRDLMRYEAVERPTLTARYDDFEVCTMAPPSSGGVAIIEMLNMLSLMNPDTIEFGSAAYVHLMAEIMRRAYEDRAAYLGDPDFNPELPVADLTSLEHAKQRMTDFNPTQAGISDSSVFNQLPEGENTTHLSVIDAAGNVVSLTYTLEFAYGSGTGSPQLGFIFNNEMGDFNPVPGFTSTRGYIGTRPNLIEPEKRMLSSMSPSIVSQNGQVYLVIGSPGGRTIINTVFQTMVAVMVYDMRVDRAIEALKIHHQWLPDVIKYEEDRLSPDTRDLLEAMGHEMLPVQALGVLMGIQVDGENHIYIGAADSNSEDGAAVGY